MNAYRQQQLRAAALIEQGADAEQIASVYGWIRGEPEPIETGDKKTLTAPRKCGIIKAIRRHVRRMKKTGGKTMKTYTRYEHAGYDIYVSDDKNRVHHAVKIDTTNPTTLYPYEPCKTGGLDNCCDCYTLQQVKNRMKTGKIVFR
jgi:hypothetical protein